MRGVARCDSGRAFDDTGHIIQLDHRRGARSLADLIVLRWLAVPHEVVPMALDPVKSPAYLAFDPGGNVPLLVHDGFAPTENVAILGRPAGLDPHARLAGDGTPRGRADVMPQLPTHRRRQGRAGRTLVRQSCAPHPMLG